MRVSDIAVQVAAEIILQPDAVGVAVVRGGTRAGEGGGDGRHGDQRARNALEVVIQRVVDAAHAQDGPKRIGEIQIGFAEDRIVIGGGTVVRHAVVVHDRRGHQLRNVPLVEFRIDGVQIVDTRLIVDEMALGRGDAGFLGDLVERQIAMIFDCRECRRTLRDLVVILILVVLPLPVAGDRRQRIAAADIPIGGDARAAVLIPDIAVHVLADVAVRGGRHHAGGGQSRREAGIGCHNIGWIGNLAR